MRSAFGALHWGAWGDTPIFIKAFATNEAVPLLSVMAFASAALHMTGTSEGKCAFETLRDLDSSSGRQTCVFKLQIVVQIESARRDAGGNSASGRFRLENVSGFFANVKLHPPPSLSPQADGRISVSCSSQSWVLGLPS